MSENKADIRVNGKDYKPIYAFTLEDGYTYYIVEDSEGTMCLLNNDRGLPCIADKDTLDSMISRYKTCIEKMEEAAKFFKQ